MTGYGFVIGTTLMSTLFVFDLYCTKYCRMTYWGRTMQVYYEAKMHHLGFYLVVWQWLSGFIAGDDTVYFFQYLFTYAFWLWFALLFALSTHFYYANEIYKLKTKEGI